MGKFKLLNKSNWILKMNIVFVLVFLNIWDYVTSGELFNAMVLGIAMFALPMALWLMGSFKAVMFNTFVSIMTFVTLSVFILQSFELNGAVTGASKSLFWLPYILLAGFNAFWGLRIYAKNRAKVEAAV